MKVSVCIILFTSILHLSIGHVMQTVFEWNEINFEDPSGSFDETVTNSSNFNFVQPLDVDRDHAGRVFMTFLVQKKIPVTLGVVTNVNTPTGPLIRPYPDWSWFQHDNCSSFRNVVRIAIDKCNRMWVLDDGFILGHPILCQARMVVIDLNTDKLLKIITIPDEIFRKVGDISLLANIIVDANGTDCLETTVYIADIFGKTLIVYKEIKNERVFFCRKKHPDFSFDPKAVNLKSGGLSDQFNGSLLGLAISHVLYPEDTKSLYFRPFASFSMMSTPVDDLRCTQKNNLTNIKKVTDVLPSQSIVMAFSSQNTLFFGMTKENAIGCWNKYRPLTRENLGVVDQSCKNLQYLNGLKVKRSTPKFPEEELWVLSNRYLAFKKRLFNRKNKNFRILRATVKSIVNNTSICNIPKNIKISSDTY